MEKITLETAKTGSELVLETLRDLGMGAYMKLKAMPNRLESWV